MNEHADLVLGLMMGVSLSACAGLRAFLPLFMLGLAAHVGAHGLRLPPDMAWLAGTRALIALGSASVFEILADKVPVLDHALDSLGTLLRPLAGAALMTAACPTEDPLTRYVLAIMVGGGTAVLFHTKKSTARVASSLATAGLGNPFLSCFEDLACAGGCLGALLAPLLSFLLCLAALALGLWWIRRATRTPGSQRQEPARGA